MTFRKGQSGNPAGRRPGTGKVAKLRASIEKNIPAIIETLTSAAAAGDVAAAKLLLDRTLPVLKPETRPLPPSAPVDPQGIVAALSDGSLTTEQAREIMALLADKAAIGSKLEDGERLERIEVLLTRPGEPTRTL